MTNPKFLGNFQLPQLYPVSYGHNHYAPNLHIDVLYIISCIQLLIRINELRQIFEVRPVQWLQGIGGLLETYRERARSQADRRTQDDL